MKRCTKGISYNGAIVPNKAVNNKIKPCLTWSLFATPAIQLQPLSCSFHLAATMRSWNDREVSNLVHAMAKSGLPKAEILEIFFSGYLKILVETYENI